MTPRSEMLACVRSLLAAGAPHGPECDELISATEKDWELPGTRMTRAMSKALILGDAALLKAGLASKEFEPDTPVTAPFGSIPAAVLSVMALMAPPTEPNGMKVLTLLLDSGLDVNREDSIMGQPTMCLIHMLFAFPGMLDGVAVDVTAVFLGLLIKRKANLEAVTGAGLTALALASQLGPSEQRTAAMRVLAKAGASADAKRADGTTVREAVPASDLEGGGRAALAGEGASGGCCSLQ